MILEFSKRFRLKKLYSGEFYKIDFDFNLKLTITEAKTYCLYFINKKYLRHNFDKMDISTFQNLKHTIYHKKNILCTVVGKKIEE